MILVTFERLPIVRVNPEQAGKCPQMNQINQMRGCGLRSRIGSHVRHAMRTPGDQATHGPTNADGVAHHRTGSRSAPRVPSPHFHLLALHLIKGGQRGSEFLLFMFIP